MLLCRKSSIYSLIYKMEEWIIFYSFCLLKCDRHMNGLLRPVRVPVADFCPLRLYGPGLIGEFAGTVSDVYGIDLGFFAEPFCESCFCGIDKVVVFFFFYEVYRASSESAAHHS